MLSQLLDMAEHSSYQLFRCFWIVQGNVVRNRIQVTQRRFGADYFSHRAMRCLA